MSGSTHCKLVNYRVFAMLHFFFDITGRDKTMQRLILLRVRRKESCRYHSLQHGGAKKFKNVVLVFGGCDWIIYFFIVFFHLFQPGGICRNTVNYRVLQSRKRFLQSMASPKFAIERTWGLPVYRVSSRTSGQITNENTTKNKCRPEKNTRLTVVFQFAWEVPTNFHRVKHQAGLPAQSVEAFQNAHRIF